MTTLEPIVLSFQVKIPDVVRSMRRNMSELPLRVHQPFKQWSARLIKDLGVELPVSPVHGHKFGELFDVIADQDVSRINRGECWRL